MPEIIYIDIDGTLRDESRGIPESAKYAVQRCREKGIFVVICTGRNPGSIQDDVKAVTTDGIISGGGCYITFRGELLRRSCFPADILANFLKEIKKQKLGAALEAENNVYMNREAADFYRKDFYRKLPEGADAERISRENKICYEDNFSGLRKERGRIHKICLVGNRDQIDNIETGLSGKAHAVQKKKWNGMWYAEFLPEKEGKGAAVSFLNQKLGIRKEDSMSFGDGENDIDMFLASGIRIAVENGSKKLIPYADSLCAPPADGGIYRELVRRKIIEANTGTGYRKERRA